MLQFAVALALAVQQSPPPIFMAVLAETASGFKSMAECERTLGAPVRRTNGKAAQRGSLFNRKAGNISRCEIVDGEPLIVVVPKPFARRAR